ncbi:hypothetical protein ACHAWF_016655 [Thalassiosira exigua]
MNVHTHTTEQEQALPVSSVGDKEAKAAEVVVALGVRDEGAPKKPTAFGGIEGWRYLVALWIYIFHYGSHWTSETSNVYTAQVQTAVATFFVMSGFVLAFAYEKRDWSNNGGKQWLWFMGTRLARVYPLYFISWIASLYWTIEGTHWGQTWFQSSVCETEVDAGTTAARVITSFLLSQSWFPYTYFAVNGPAWFLSSLVWVWTTFPLFIRLLKKLQSSYALFAVAIISYVIGLIPTIVLWSTKNFYQGCTSFVFRDNPIFRVPEFVVGMCFGCIFNRNQAGSSEAPQHYPRRLVKWVGDLAFLTIIVPIFAYDEFKGMQHELFLPRLVVLPMAVVIYFSAWKQGFIAAIVSAPGLCDLGRYAWGIFILQEPFWYSLCSLVTGNGELQCFAHDDKTSGWAREANNVIGVFLLLNVIAGLCLKWEVPLYKVCKVKIEKRLGLAKLPEKTEEIEENSEFAGATSGATTGKGPLDFKGFLEYVGSTRGVDNESKV